MKLQVLGCHGGELPSCRSTCFLLDGVLALDAGALTSTLSLEQLCRVDDILVGHSHFDHVKDLPLLVSMAGVGVAWASILAMPYAILTGSLPAAKMGYYMGVFNFFIVIPQIVAAALLGFLVRTFFGGAPIWALAIGAGSLVVAAALTLRVEDRDDGRETGAWHPGFPKSA